jgi:hypothetical protein
MDGEDMPTISLFYGIVVRMYDEADGRHNKPHIHAEYSGSEVALDLDGNILEGKLPPGKMKLLLAWIEIHKEDLEANWMLLSEGKQFFRIDPLK